MLCATSLFATHNRAGEITYQHVEGNTYEVTIITCTDISESTNADREWMPIDWGHVIGPGSNTRDSIQRVLTIEVVPDVTQRNEYTILHTFPGPGVYTLKTEDPNRNAGVNNIPGSVDQIFSISSQLRIYSGLDFRFNNSVELLNPPKEDGCVGQIWSHSVVAFDVDGDSLGYELIPCTGGNNLVIEDYSFPDFCPSQGANGEMTFDEQFGILTWDTPMLTGLYNVAIRITEYRNGLIMGYVIRDMQISIATCSNQAPVNDPLPDVCIIAGEDLVVQISASDPNGDDLEFSVEGDPFETSDANFTDLNSTPPSGTMQWTPDCSEVRLDPYLVYVRVDDNVPDQSLSDNDGFAITVIAPPVEGVATQVLAGGDIEISWDNYVCQNATGYKIYRRAGSSSFMPDFCETGLPASAGYDLIATTSSAALTSFVDVDPTFGDEVCYRIVACFLDGAESIVSDEVCDAISAVIPVITKVSVGLTSTTVGIDTVAWEPPVALDTLTIFTGPYSYNIYRATAPSSNYELVSTTSETVFLDNGSQEYIDTELDTRALRYQYRIVLLNAGQEVSQSNEASSVYLQAEPTDTEVLLTWTADVPWTTQEYEVFIFDNNLSEFVSIGITEEDNFVASGLENNIEYCFVVRATTGYPGTDVLGPYFNVSQEQCTSPYDNRPPCPPVLEITGDCEFGDYQVTWEIPNDGCADDVAGFSVFYSAIEGQDLQFLTQIDNPFETVLLDFEGDLFGCFAISAYDSLSTYPDGSLVSNESDWSEIICIESCPEYNLPNVISPNGDGLNDFFEPFRPYAYVDSIDLQIYNRWGNIIFASDDPDILWGGANQESGERVSDGVYFYTIKIFEQTLQGIVPRNEAGQIQVFDNRKSAAE